MSATLLAPESRRHAPPQVEVIPPLENGDRLTQPEFHRRYERMPRIKKAELIEGKVYMGSPVRTDVHAEPHADLSYWLKTYQYAMEGTKVSDNSSVYLDSDNEPQPDLVLRIEQRAGGRSSLNAAGYLKGPPELVAEISASSASYDLREKKNAYRRNGVREYIVWQVLDRRLDWWELVEAEYREIAADDKGIIESRVFPGLRLDVEKLLNGDFPGILAELQRGLASEACAAFRERLADR